MIELLVVVALVTVCSVFLLSASFLSLRSSQVERTRLLITKNVLEYELEYLQQQSFNSLIAPSTISNFMEPYAITTELATPGSFPEVRLITARQYAISSINADLKQVTVQVTWADQSGHSRTQSLSTYIARPVP